jgi:hypothetical protein
MSLTEKIISKIIQDYLRENVSNYLEGVGDALAKELVSKGATLNGIDMKYFLDDKEVTLYELAQAIDDLDPGNERHCESEVIELEEIKNGAMYFVSDCISWD